MKTSVAPAQPDLFGAPTWPIHHPGSACCDPTQDLAGWIAEQTRQLDVADRWARVYSKRGRRLRREATKALTRGNATLSRELDDQSYLYCRAAWSIHTPASVRRGDVERITAAHRERLEAEATR